MAVIILLAYAVGSFIALILLIALFTKKDYAILRQVHIAKPKDEVFEYLRFLKNQDHFNKWVMIDPKVRKQFKGTDGTVGFTSSWDSDNRQVGKGEQEIKRIIAGKRIDYEIRFEKPFKAISPAYLVFEPADNDGTHVKWGFEGRMSYPMNAMMLFIDIPGILAKDLDVSLKNLKGIMERTLF
jgi:hypothetical protein